MDSTTKVFYGVGGAMALAALVALDWGIPRVLRAGDVVAGPATAVLMGIPVLAMATSVLVNAASDAPRDAHVDRSSRSARGSFSITTTSWAPAIVCWVGAAALLVVLALALPAFGAGLGVIGLVVAGYVVNWGRRARPR